MADPTPIDLEQEQREEEPGIDFGLIVFISHFGFTCPQCGGAVTHLVAENVLLNGKTKVQVLGFCRACETAVVVNLGPITCTVAQNEPVN